jgi:hypothetical protein
VLLNNGDGTFQAPVTVTSSNAPSAVAIADVNGDGHPDLAVADLSVDFSTEGGVSVLLNNGDGTFQPAVTYLSGGHYGQSVAVGDVNGDGYPDLVVAARYLCIQSRVRCQQGIVGVLAGNGDGTFQPAVTYRSGRGHGLWAWSVAIGDVNGDGKPDLVVENAFSSTAAVLLNGLAARRTTTKVASSLNPSQVNQPVTFTATVTSRISIPNGSTVTFSNGATKIGTGTTTNGVATLTTSFSTAGKYTIKASYPGDAFHKASSGTVKQVVNP